MRIDLHSYTDDDLVFLCQKGQESAFLELYERYKQRIINFAFRMMRDRDAAADVLQETYQYFFRKIPEYRAEGKLSILLFRAARSICLNRLKKSRRAKELPLEEEALACAGNDDVSKPLEVEELKENVALALNRLPSLYSEVIILRILRGLPVADVAEIVGCPEGTVKSRLHNGLELMRKTLRKRDFV